MTLSSLSINGRKKSLGLIDIPECGMRWSLNVDFFSLRGAKFWPGSMFLGIAVMWPKPTGNW